jgi:hypothetical protein
MRGSGVSELVASLGEGVRVAFLPQDWGARRRGTCCLQEPAPQSSSPLRLFASSPLRLFASSPLRLFASSPHAITACAACSRCTACSAWIAVTAIV